jgi:hypothetical protein
MDTNPYASNSAQMGGSPYQSGGIHPQVIDILAKTRGWIWLCAIIGLLIAGLIFIGGTGLILGSPRTQGVGITYLVFGAVYVYPAIQLVRCASAISKLMVSGSSRHLIQVVNQQRKFWRFSGLFICLIALLLLFTVARITIGSS